MSFLASIDTLKHDIIWESNSTMNLNKTRTSHHMEQRKRGKETFVQSSNLCTGISDIS